MKCEKCKKRESTIHLSQTRQGKTAEYHLCEACAKDQGISLDVHDYIGKMDSTGKIFGAGFMGGGSVFDTAGGIPAFGAVVNWDISCPDCSRSFDDFRRTGLLGCSHCYEAFADRLDPVLRRVQGSTRHVGRKVCQSADQQEEQLLRGKLSDLKQSLLQAVQVEAYETAARLRDEIKTLEQRLCVEGGEMK